MLTYLKQCTAIPYEALQTALKGKTYTVEYKVAIPYSLKTMAWKDTNGNLVLPGPYTKDKEDQVYKILIGLKLTNTENPSLERIQKELEPMLTSKTNVDVYTTKNINLTTLVTEEFIHLEILVKDLINFDL